MSSSSLLRWLLFCGVVGLLALGCIRVPEYSFAPTLSAPTGPGAVAGGGGAYSSVVTVNDSLDFSAEATADKAGEGIAVTAEVVGGNLSASAAGFTESFPVSVNGASPQTLSLTGTADELGFIELRVTAQNFDGSDSWTLTIYINAPPELGSPTGPGSVTGSAPSYAATVSAFDSLDLSITATDPDPADQLILRATVTGGNLSAAQAGFAESFPVVEAGTSPLTLSLTGTAEPVEGEIELTFEVEDAAGETVAVTLSITIEMDSPEITNEPDTVAIVDDPWSFTPMATGDPPPTIDVTGHPSWLSWDGTTLSGTPGPGDKGTTADITVTASNGVGSDAVLIFAIDVCDWDLVQSAGADLWGVWGTGEDNVFAVGDNGTVRHFNGTSWSSMSSSTSEDLREVWGSSSTDVFAVGLNGTILHYDGTNWSTMTSGTSENLFGVWGTSSSNAYAVGGNGTIRHFNGTNWSGESSGTTEHLYGVWGTSSDFIVAVGNGGTIRNYDGNDWIGMNSGTSSTNFWGGIWGTGTNNIYVQGRPSGQSARVRRYNGSTWSLWETAVPEWDMWGSGANNIYFVGGGGGIHRFDGISVEAMSTPTAATLRGVWGTSETNIIVVGHTGTILHFGP